MAAGRDLARSSRLWQRTGTRGTPLQWQRCPLQWRLSRPPAACALPGRRSCAHGRGSRGADIWCCVIHGGMSSCLLAGVLLAWLAVTTVVFIVAEGKHGWGDKRAYCVLGFTPPAAGVPPARAGATAEEDRLLSLSCLPWYRRQPQLLARRGVELCRPPTVKCAGPSAARQSKATLSVAACREPLHFACQNWSRTGAHSGCWPAREAACSRAAPVVTRAHTRGSAPPVPPPTGATRGGHGRAGGGGGAAGPKGEVQSVQPPCSAALRCQAAAGTHAPPPPHQPPTALAHSSASAQHSSRQLTAQAARACHPHPRPVQVTVVSTWGPGRSMRQRPAGGRTHKVGGCTHQKEDGSTGGAAPASLRTLSTQARNASWYAAGPPVLPGVGRRALRKSNNRRPSAASAPARPPTPSPGESPPLLRGQRGAPAAQAVRAPQMRRGGKPRGAALWGWGSFGGGWRWCCCHAVIVHAHARAPFGRHAAC